MVPLLLFVGLVLWRGAIRIGPQEPPASGARRSLAEQICGTGSFMARRDGGAALHAAAVRALEEAATRRIAGYAALPVRERTVSLAGLTGIGADALTDAMYHGARQRLQELPATIRLLETARRRILSATKRTNEIHGTA